MLLAITGCGLGQAQTLDSFSSINLSVVANSSGGLALSCTNISSISSWSDDQLTTLVNVLDATPIISASDLPRGGVGIACWSLQNPNWPPLPGNTIGVDAWLMSDGNLLLDDLNFDYDAVSASPMRMSMMSAGGISLPGGGDGGDGTNYYSPAGSPMTIIDYSTNLWIAQTAVASGNLTGIGTNTLPYVQYEIQSRTNLVQGNWQSEGFVLGSVITNWTPLSIVQNGRTNLFIRLKSWGSSDGSGIPDWWEALYGLNNVDPNALDSAGDGYTIYQKYQLGLNPSVFYTPATPQGMAVQLNQANQTASITWFTSAGPVTGYTVEKTDYNSNPPTVQNFNVSSTIKNYVDSLSGDSFSSWSGNPLAFVSDAYNVGYRMQVHYSLGSSSWTPSMNVQPPTVQGTIVPGGRGQTYLQVSAVPANAVSVRLVLGFSDLLQNITVSNDIPIWNFTNGLYLMPSNWQTEFNDPSGNVDFMGAAVRSVDANGNLSALSPVNYDWGLPFYDARAQLKENLIFLLRAATIDGPLEIEEYTNGVLADAVTSPANYACSSFYSFAPTYGVNYPYLDTTRPFINNYLYRNLVFNSADVDAYGKATTGVDDTNNLPGAPINLDAPETYDFQLGVSSLAPLLPMASTVWLNFMPLSADGNVGENVGLATTDNGDYTSTYMLNSARNSFGLPILSVNFWGADPNSGNPLNRIMNPGNSTTVYSFAAGAPVNLYFEAAQPGFETKEYDFWDSSRDALPGLPLPAPAGVNFSPNNAGRTLVVPVGSPVQVAGYAKLAVTNSIFSNVYGYLGQYFDKAYLVDANGNVTTNTTGILSPYGNFLATQSGQAAVVTMPDVDPPYQRGTCMVYCVALQLDKNHDGSMDPSFNGVDATSVGSPYVYWVNNDFDRVAQDSADQTNYEDSVEALRRPGILNWFTGWTMPPDGDYRDGDGNRVIPTQRDLEDFARLWVCGITTNLLAALPAGTTITLDWGDVGNPNTNNPTIDLFQAADADGGVGYLTNSATAALQTNISTCPYIGRLEPGQQIQLNGSQFPNNWAGEHLIWCGVGGGTGKLTLTISQGGTNTLAQTSAYIQLVDIKQMYERWTVGEVSTVPPTNHASLAGEDLPPGVTSFQYGATTDTNTPYILFVHGWNMKRYDKDRFAETAFKRLYWQGYQGRFGSFRWPTDFNFNGTLTQLITDVDQKDNYDRSEYQAWRSGQGLLNKLNDLNAQYPGHVYMLAHSMGNIVASEALRLSGSTQVVNTYIASQAALPAHTYDPTVPNYSFVYIGTIYACLTAHTPNIYGNWFAGNSGGGAGQIVNFFNANDYALQRSAWQLDQLMKPDQNVAQSNGIWTFAYNGSTSDPAPWNYFSKFYISGGVTNTVTFDIVNTLTNRYEVMAFAAQSWTTALGATPGVGSVKRNVDLTSQDNKIWPFDTNPNFQNDPYGEHFYHSAEFRSNYWQQQGYWRELLGADGFNLK